MFFLLVLRLTLIYCIPLWRWAWHGTNNRSEVTVLMRLYTVRLWGNDEACMISVWQTQFRIFSVWHTVTLSGGQTTLRTYITLDTSCRLFPRSLESQSNCQGKGCQRCWQDFSRSWSVLLSFHSVHTVVFFLCAGNGTVILFVYLWMRKNSVGIKNNTGT